MQEKELYLKNMYLSGTSTLRQEFGNEKNWLRS